MQIQFDNSYAALPDRFFARVSPTPVTSPRLIKLNRPLAEQLRLDADWLASPAGIGFLAGQAVPQGADPIATAYAGHQFGNFVPQLGDGRAITLGEVTNTARRDLGAPAQGRRPDAVLAARRRSCGVAIVAPRAPRVQRGDVIPSAYRRRVRSHWSRPASRSIAICSTTVVPPTSPAPSCAASHRRSRCGSAATILIRRAYDHDTLRRLVDFTLLRDSIRVTHRRGILPRGHAAHRVALLAEWMRVGFVHGVMNTDNMSILGLDH